MALLALLRIASKAFCAISFAPSHFSSALRHEFGAKDFEAWSPAETERDCNAMHSFIFFCFFEEKSRFDSSKRRQHTLACPFELNRKNLSERSRFSGKIKLYRERRKQRQKKSPTFLCTISKKKTKLHQRPVPASHWDRQRTSRRQEEGRLS